MPGTFDGSVGLASVFFPAPGSPDFRMQSGAFASASLIAPGTTRLAFQQGIAPEDAVASLSLRGSTTGTATVIAWTPTYLEVLTSDTLGAPAELEFDLVLLQQPTGIPYVAPPVPPAPPGPSLTNLKSWYRADDITVANGAPVPLWPDRVGTSDLATWFAAPNPTFVASDANYNNQPSVNFNNGERLGITNPPDYATGDAALTVIFVFLPNWPVANTTFFQYSQGGAPFQQIDFATTSGPNTLRVVNSFFSLIDKPAAPPGAIVFYFSLPQTGLLSNAEFLVNNTNPAPSSFADGGPMNIPNPFPSIVFGRNFWQGTIAEVLYYDSVLTPAEQTQTYSYLATRYAIP